jgi:hypothetical protein
MVPPPYWLLLGLVALDHPFDPTDAQFATLEECQNTGEVASKELSRKTPGMLVLSSRRSGIAVFDNLET